MNPTEIEKKAKNFLVRASGHTRGKYGLSNEDAVKKAKQEDPDGHRAFMAYETAQRAKSDPLPVATPPAPIVVDQPALPPKAETTDEGQTMNASAAASSREAEKTPHTFEAEVSHRIRQGATPEQAVRGTASMYPRLQADYFRRIREGQADSLAAIWQ